ncbi:MAG: copper chaperone PCu(A)C [Gammaproteobacteria bacterium]|nr:copper chaperone PCu(A)C [Gammaproteobacteria bacterium]
MKLLFTLTLVLLSFSAIADVAKNVNVEQSYVRSAIKQQRNSAAFMNITNQGSQAAIVYAKSPVAKIVELHTHIHDNGVMRMRKVEQIDLPTDKVIQLQPGGLHIMFLGLNQDLKPGDQIDVTLGFKDGSEKVLLVPVRNMLMQYNKI